MVTIFVVLSRKFYRFRSSNVWRRRMNGKNNCLLIGNVISYHWLDRCLKSWIMIKQFHSNDKTLFLPKNLFLFPKYLFNFPSTLFSRKLFLFFRKNRFWLLGPLLPLLSTFTTFCPLLPHFTTFAHLPLLSLLKIFFRKKECFHNSYYCIYFRDRGNSPNSPALSIENVSFK